MKTFEDLEFTLHPSSRNVFCTRYINHKWAKMDFGNGYGVSVVFGASFYSDR